MIYAEDLVLQLNTEEDLPRYVTKWNETRKLQLLTMELFSKQRNSSILKVLF